MCGSAILIPDCWEDLESIAPNMAPKAAVGYCEGILHGDLLIRFRGGLGQCLKFEASKNREKGVETGNR